MKLLIVSKNLLDQRDAQSQQTLALIMALQRDFDRVDIVTARTTSEELLALKRFVGSNVFVYDLPGKWISNGANFLDKIKRKIQRNMMAASTTRWAKLAGSLSNELDARNNYSAIMTIGLPIESHMVGLLLKEKRKWIAHFSDPWPESLMPKPYSDYSIPIVSALQKRVVQKTLSKAGHVSFTCTQSRDLFLDHYDLNVKETSVVPHIAPSPVRPIRRKDDRFLITHAGSLSRERFSPDFFLAVSELSKESKIIVQFIGNVHKSAMDLVGELGIQDRFVFLGQLDKEVALGHLRESDALLLIEAEMDRYPFLPSKLADYSAVGIPVYAITGKNSAVVEVIERCGAGYASRHSKKDIIETLLKIEEGLFSRSHVGSMYDCFKSDNAKSAVKEIISRLSKL